MNYITAALASCCAFMGYAAEIRPQESENKEQSSVIIILEDGSSESIAKTSNQFSTSYLTAALIENSSPVITTTQLLLSLFQLRDEFAFQASQSNTPEYQVKKAYEDIELSLNNWAQKLETSIYDKVHLQEILADKISTEFYKGPKEQFKEVKDRTNNLFHAYNSHFDVSLWDLYIHKDGALCLLIPKKNDRSGFALENFTAIEQANISSSFLYFHANNTTKDESLSLLPALKGCFSKEKRATWDIYLCGHGIRENLFTKSIMANLPIQEFTDFLDFLNNHLLIHSFFYQTCISGGTNFNSLFKDDSQSYHFPLVSLCLNDTVSTNNGAATCIRHPHNNDLLKPDDITYNAALKRWELKKFFNYNWQKFFENIKSLDFVTINAKAFWKAYTFIADSNHYNTPLIMPAHSNQKVRAHAINYSKKISDGFVALKRLEKAPLIVDGYLDIIFLETTSLAILLKIETDKIVRFWSIMPGYTTHYIQTIDAQKTSHETIIKAFVQPDGSHYNKDFCIDELTCLLTDKMLADLFKIETNSPITLKEVLISTTKDEIVTFFFQTQTGQVFTTYATSKGEGMRYFAPVTGDAETAYKKRYAELKQQAIDQSAAKQNALCAAFSAALEAKAS